MLRTNAGMLFAPPARLRLRLLLASLRSTPLLPSPFSPPPSHHLSSAASLDSNDPNNLTDLPIQASAPLTQESVLYVLKKLDKMPHKALDFFNHVRAQRRLDPGPATYNLMLRILGRKDSIKDFWAFLKTMDDDGRGIEHSTYLTLLSSFKKQKLSAESAALAKFYSRSAERAASDAAIRSAAEIILGSEDWNEAVEKKICDLNLSLSENAVAKVIREARDQPIKALHFFRWAGRRPEYKHGSVAYNAMVRVLGREDSIEEFRKLIEEMKGEGHDMDIDTYIKLSRQFQKTKMTKEAVALYEHMMDGPYKPAIQDCGMLLRHISLSSAPDLDLVFRVVKKYEAAGYSLSKVVYDGIHRCLTSVGKFDEADDILKRMRKEGHEPDNITYSQLIYGLCKANKLDEACKVLNEMEEDGCTPDVKTWTVLIQGHCTAGAVDKALECLTKMLEKGGNADADLLDVLVKGLCSNKKIEGAHTLMVEMVDKARVRPWQATYKYLIQELLQVGKLEEALKLLSSMKSQKFPPFADPFPPYISKFGTTEDAKEFLKALTVSQNPSSTAYLNVFKSFFKEARYSEAQDILFKCPHHIRKHADISKLFGSIQVSKTA